MRQNICQFPAAIYGALELPDKLGDFVCMIVVVVRYVNTIDAGDRPGLTHLLHASDCIGTAAVNEEPGAITRNDETAGTERHDPGRRFLVDRLRHGHPVDGR